MHSHLNAIVAPQKARLQDTRDPNEELVFTRDIPRLQHVAFSTIKLVSTNSRVVSFKACLGSEIIMVHVVFPTNGEIPCSG